MGRAVAGTYLSQKFANVLSQRGCDFVDVSSGGNSPDQKIEVGPGYQTGFAAHIRNKSGLPTMAVGQIVEPKHAEAILRSGQADMISVAWHAVQPTLGLGSR